MKSNTDKKLKIVPAKTKSLVKDSSNVRETLLKRWEEMKLNPGQILLDARLKGMKFNFAQLSRYMHHGNVQNSLTEESIIWLCVRYGINLKLLVGKFTVDLQDKKVKMVIEPYNEEQCLKNLKLIFNK